MRKRIILALLMCAGSLHAATLYVSAGNAGASAPYANWAAAAAGLQDAVNAASVGDLILVTNGIYSIGGAVAPGYGLTNRVMLKKAVTVRSVNGPEVTVIEGAADSSGQVPETDCGAAAVRCAYVASNAVLDGFTLKDGHTYSYLETHSLYTQCGGGAFLDGSGTVTNCKIVNCVAEMRGGGVFLYQGGIVDGCTVTGNYAVAGGGVFLQEGGTVRDSTISYNVIDPDYSGGGAALTHGGLLENCELRGNTAYREDHMAFDYYTTPSHGGGVYIAYSGTVNRCLIADHVTSLQGAGGYVLQGGIFNNCIFENNTATDLDGATYTGTGDYAAGAAVKLHAGGEVNHCVLYNNTCMNTGYGGGVYCALGGEVRNSVVYSNSASGGDNWGYDTSAVMEYLCTTPDTGLPGGTGITSASPQFSDPASGDYSLQSGSPCIDAGTSSSVDTDYAGNARPLDGDGNGSAAADIGAYEFVLSSADSDGDSMQDGWEIAYGLSPIADDAGQDADSDQINNLDEWISDSNPLRSNSPFSVEGMTLDELNRLELSVPSSTGRVYSLSYRTNLVSGSWLPVNGQTGRTGNGTLLVMTDTNQVLNNAFYRVEVALPTP